jgi:hypothetical protein
MDMIISNIKDSWCLTDSAKKHLIIECLDTVNVFMPYTVESYVIRTVAAKTTGDRRNDLVFVGLHDDLYDITLNAYLHAIKKINSGKYWWKQVGYTAREEIRTSVYHIIDKYISLNN